MSYRILVTGGSGFVGSHVVDVLLADPDVEFVLDVDALVTGSLYGRRVARPPDRYRRHVGYLGKDLQATQFAALLLDHDITHVLHVAAESHVDRSIDGPGEFLIGNVLGTAAVLDGVRMLNRHVRVLVVSTDEVYGDRDGLPPARETDPFHPSSPYAASKAAADQLARCYARTYGLDVVVTRGGNTFGTRQVEEKLIPKAIRMALGGQRITVHGDGLHTREWMSVRDHADAIWQVALRGRSGEAYNVGGGERAVKTTLDIAHHVLRLCDQDLDRYCMVPDRPGNDRAYGMRTDKIQEELAWVPVEKFEAVLQETVEFYRTNRQ